MNGIFIDGIEGMESRLQPANQYAIPTLSNRRALNRLKAGLHTSIGIGKSPKPRLWGWLTVCGGLVLAALLAGCAGSRHAARGLGAEEARIAAATPPFLAGAPGVLLTNVDCFSARMDVEVTTALKTPQSISGELLGQGGRLLFAPKIGDRSYIWDPTASSGFVLSEALQGYAPLGSDVRVASVAANSPAGGPASERANGHSCRKEEGVITWSDGTATQFTVWRAADLKGFPVRIKSADGPKQFTVNFQEIRLEPSSPKLFLPPDGFTPYESADSMLTEYMMRKAAPKKKEEPAEDLGPRPAAGAQGTGYQGPRM